MNYSEIYYNDTVNGKGYRTSLFVSGCDKNPKCKGCWNVKAQSFTYGYKFTSKEKEDIIKSLKPDYIYGLSILGGEPFSNIYDETLLDLVKTIKEIYPNKTIYCWSGYTFEELIKNEKAVEFMKYLDMLRDGEFIEELKDVTQYLEGSSNQRIIDVKESLKANKVVLWTE